MAVRMNECAVIPGIGKESELLSSAWFQGPESNGAERMLSEKYNMYGRSIPLSN